MNKMKYLVNILITCFFIIPVLTFISCDDDKEITDAVKVSSIVVDNATDNTIKLIEHDTYPVIVKVMPEDAVDKEEYTFKYSSSNDTVFTVSEDGIITALYPGEAILRVDAVNNTDMWGLCIVSIEKRVYPVTSINIPDKYKDFNIGVDKVFDLGSLVSVSPENVSNPGVIYTSSDEMLATVDEDGLITTHALGDVTITIKAIDGSEVFTECKLHIKNIVYSAFDRSDWTVAIPYEHTQDATVDGRPECIIDGDNTTCLVLIKPGKTLNGVTIPEDQEAYLILDMQSPRRFDYFQLRHRNSTTQNMLRVRKISLYGSNDGIDFIEIQKDMAVPGVDNGSAIAPEPFDLPSSEYRYVKMVYEEWNKSSGNSMQISEVNVGTIEYED